MKFKIGDEVEFVKYDKRDGQRTTEINEGMEIGQKLIITFLCDYNRCEVNYRERWVYNYQIKHISKPKKKPYWIEVEQDVTGAWNIIFVGRNNFILRSDWYSEKRVANQQAKRLAKNLGLEFRQ